jgi:hypothetical protein
MRRVFLPIVLFSFFIFPVFTFAFVPIPLGGKVTITKPCDEGLLITLKTSKGVSGPYMWLWGNLPYRSRIIPHIDQNILGMAKTVPIPCTISGYPYSGGVPIIFHGSGL